MSAAVTVKGIREGVLITLNSGDLADVLDRLAELVESRQTFFSGGKVALRVGDRKLTFQDVARLQQVFEERGVDVWAILSTDPSTRAVVKELGLRTTFASRPPSQAPAGNAPLTDGARCRLSLYFHGSRR